VRLLLVTGGPAVVKAAMQTGKRAIAPAPAIRRCSWMTRVPETRRQSHHPGGGVRQQFAVHREKEVFVLEHMRTS